MAGTPRRPVPASGPRPPGLARGRIGQSVAALSVLGLIAVGVVAAHQPGFPQQPPVPVNRSIWVADADRSLVGRINPAAGQLDSALTVKGSVEVIQDPAVGTPAMLDRSAHELQLIDPTTVTLGARVAVPTDAAVAIGAGTVAVADRSDGRLWFGSTVAIGSVDAHLVKQQATLGADPAVAVSTSGTVFATAAGSSTITVGHADGTLTTQAVPGGRLPGRSVPQPALPGQRPAPAQSGQANEAGHDVQISAVGEIPVVLDRSGPDLRVGDRRLALPNGLGLQTSLLQLPGPASDAIYLITTTALLRVALATGTVTEVSASGIASTGALPPIQAGGCTYAVWTGATAVAVRACPGATGTPQALPGTTASSVLRIGANGDAVAVNDSTSGRSFLAADGFRVVDNWLDVTPTESANTDQNRVQNPDVSDRTPPPPPSCAAAQIGRPHARDDAFGVRAGRATVLRVLDNDQGTDCTSVVIDRVSALPVASGTVAIVDGGGAIQVTAAAGATGTLPPIRYEVTNGRGQTAAAVVLVTVEPPSVQRPPAKIRRPALEVEAGATVIYNVLQDYYSPTGDDLYLLSASTDGGDAASYRSDGSITYRSTGTGAGTDRKVQFIVSDGTQQSAGVMTVTIAEAGSSTPVSLPVHATGFLGSTLSIDPTRTLTTASARPVVIGKLTAMAGDSAASATLAPGGRLISVTASSAGSFYFTFDAATGDHSTTGILRADFIDGSSAGTPVPMVDVAYLPAGGSTVLDPLANDSDPAGRGLAVRQVQVPDGVSLTAAVVDLHLVKIEAPRPPDGPISLSYSLYDGRTSQTGQIRVVPVPAIRQVPPPVATPISVTVRAGDAVTIPVADHAYSQDGSAVTAVLDAGAVSSVPGRVFSTGFEIRYLAPALAPSTPITFVYTAVAASSTPADPVQASSTVTITVVGADASQDRAPGAPAPVVARVFAGGSISVALPLDGIDPDGDWVVTSSLRQPVAPLGSVSLLGSNALSYQAFSKPGVDVISYLVTDPYGKSAVGTATVLVVPPVDAAGPPIAPDLTASVRPGRSIRIDPLQDVVDPGGRTVTLGNPAFDAPPGLLVVQDDKGLVVTAPNVATRFSLRYNVINTQRLGATGAISLTVSKDAPVPLPEATDVFVPPSALRSAAPAVEVDVSAHVTNRSGRRDQLNISVDPVSAAVATMAAPMTLRITLAERRQVIAYRARNADGGVATAFVVVPGRAQPVPPELIPGRAPIQVEAGATVQVSVADYVSVAAGSPQIAADSPLGATQGTATRLSAGTFGFVSPSTAGGAAVVYVPIVSPGGTAPTVLGFGVQITPKVVPAPQLERTDVPVEVGGSAGVDLGPLTTTFDASQAASLTYRLGSVTGPSGASDLTVAITGALLTVSVRQGTVRGTEYSVPVTVVDGQGRTGAAVMTVRVTGSRKPRPVIVDAHLTSSRPGVAVRADVLVGSSDPIGLGLTVGRVRVTAGATGVRSGPTLTGSTISVTPAAGFVGDIVVSFQVGDGTRDPDRTVDGTLTITTQDVPSAPGMPAAVAGTLTAGSVEIIWAPSNSHGSVVTGYTVSGGGVVQACPGPGTGCRIDGLTAGTTYQFAVVAHSAVGDSRPSPRSAPIVPDAAPTRPSPPQVLYLQRGQVLLDWQIPTGDFSPVTSMTLRRVLDGVVVQTYPDVSSPLTLSDLPSHQAFAFQVEAVNAFSGSAWSDLSATVVPSGAPQAPVAVSATYGYDGVTQSVTVTWRPPTDTGGEAISGYQLLQNGAVVDPDATSPETRTVRGTATVAFTVVARNGRGPGPPSAATPAATVNPWIRPTAPGAPILTPGDTTIGMAWSGGLTPGSGLGHYEYQIGGTGGWVATGSGHTAVISGLTDRQSYSVTIRVCNTESGPVVLTCSPASPPASTTPVGPLARPTIGEVTAGTPVTTVTVTWTWPDPAGRAVASQVVTIKVDGVLQASVDAASRTWTKDVGTGATLVIDATECLTGPGQCASADQRTYTTPTASAYQVIGPPPMTGTCAGKGPYGGDWLDEAACSGTATWLQNGVTVMVLSCVAATSYPQQPPGVSPPPTTTPPTTTPPTTTPPTDPPTTTPSTDPPTTTTTPPPVLTDSRWYQDVERRWFRVPSLVGNGAPGC